MNIQNIITNEDTTWLTVNGVNYGLAPNQLLDEEGQPFYDNYDAENEISLYNVVIETIKHSDAIKGLVAQGILDKIEAEDISFLETESELLQHFDDLVTDYFNYFAIANDEDSLCEFIGLDNFHAVRDAQSQR